MTSDSSPVPEDTDDWWTVEPPPRMEDGLKVVRGWTEALGLEMRVQVRRRTHA